MNVLFIDRVFHNDDLLHEEQAVGKYRLFILRCSLDDLSRHYRLAEDGGRSTKLFEPPADLDRSSRAE